ncbi:EpsD family peptidyl-prolyl cis-trans isomerase [Massilia sp.]|uniref:EpsD family peptidyl-prolyl cis-trans isomerase n=1 Tax=Massilia sp. TaxID=1882437 RepID=UPI0028AF64FE|nr:EpsD family peptidyl-prolyl cis-trans isomerase [Massilia sp.]
MKNSYQVGAAPMGAGIVPAAVLAALLAAALAGCGDSAREAKPGQALASVNGEEITVLQLNEEIQRAGVPASRQQEASKQLLQALIDRQLLEHAAVQEKLDRDPKVLQAIERARSLIVAQAYMQRRLANLARPTAAEVEEYFNKHPEFFARRKQFRMDQLVLAARDLTPEARAAADAARSLEEVAVWLDAHQVKYGRAELTRSTSELNPELSKKLLGMPKGQLFSVREGERAMLLAVAEVREAPVSLEVAGAQIEKYLMSSKSKELAAAEVARLRQQARIEYLNKDLALGAQAAPASMTAPAAGASGEPGGQDGHAAGAASGQQGAAAQPGQEGAGPASSSTSSSTSSGTSPGAPAGDDSAGAPDHAAVDRGVAGLK